MYYAEADESVRPPPLTIIRPVPCPHSETLQILPMPDKQSTIPTDNSPTASRPRTRFLRSIAVFSFVSAVLLAVTPQLLLKTPLRNQVLKAAVPGTLFSMSAGSAGGSWLSPLHFENLVLQSETGGIHCQVRRCSTSHGLLHYLSKAVDFGKLTLHNVRLTIHLDSDDEWPEFSSGNADGLTGEFEVLDSRLQLLVSSRERPLVDFDHIDITGRILRSSGSGRELQVDPCLLMDHASLSEQSAVQNLTLIAPVLASTTQMTGAASVWLDEIRFSLDSRRVSPLPVTGHAEFHELAATPDQDMLNQIRMFSGLLGLSAPETLQLTMLQDSTVDFEIREHEIYHRSAGFMLPEINRGLQIASTGSLGFDLSLDMQLAVDLAEIGGSFSALFPDSVLPLHVTGTINDPQLSMKAPAVFVPAASQSTEKKLPNTPAGGTLFPDGASPGRQANILLRTLGSLLKQKPDTTGSEQQINVEQ